MEMDRARISQTNPGLYSVSSIIALRYQKHQPIRTKVITSNPLCLQGEADKYENRSII